MNAYEVTRFVMEQVHSVRLAITIRTVSNVMATKAIVTKAFVDLELDNVRCCSDHNHDRVIQFMVKIFVVQKKEIVAFTGEMVNCISGNVRLLTYFVVSYGVNQVISFKPRLLERNTQV